MHPPPASLSAQLTPMGMQQTSANDVLGTGEIQIRPRSKAWIMLGVLVAAGIGGGLGMVAFRMTAPPVAPTTTAAATTAPPATATPGPTTTGSANANANANGASATSMIHVVTEPAGAVVRDETMELCATTPCDVTFKGDLADPSRPHKLAFAKPGYRIESRTVKAAEGPVHVKLTKIAGAIVRPPPKGTASSDGTPAQPGFKDIPY